MIRPVSIMVMQRCAHLRQQHAGSNPVPATKYDNLMNKQMKRYIHITREDREFIAKAFGVTERMVLMATSFDKKRGNSETAVKIRKMALDRGGIMMVRTPELETFHDHDNYMRQYLPNGALLEFNKNNGEGDVYFKGKLVKHYPMVYMSDIRGIQDMAAALR